MSDDLLSTPAAGPAAVRGGGLRVLGYIVGAALSAGSAALLFRHLGVADTGRYGLVLSIVAILGGVSDLGLTAIGVREMSVRREASVDALARNLLGLRVALTVTGVAVAIAFGAGVGYRPVVIAGVLLAGAGLVLQSVANTLAIDLQSRLRLGWVTAVDLVRQVLTVGLIVALVGAGAKLLAFTAIPIPVGVAVVCMTAWLVRGEMPLRPAFRLDEWRRLIRFALPYSVAVAAAALYFRVAVILVSLLASATALGFFNASFRVVEVLIGVPQLLVGAALPIFARAAQDQGARLAYAVTRVFQTSLIAGVWFAVLLALGAPLAIDIIGGRAFAPAATILAIQGVGVAGSFVGVVWSTALLSLGRHRDILAINLTALGLGTALVAVLAAVDGARGAAVATASAEVLLAGLGAVVLRRRDPRLVSAPGTVAKVALAAACACFPALLGDVSPLVLACAGTVIYFAVLLALRALPEELRALDPRA